MNFSINSTVKIGSIGSDDAFNPSFAGKIGTVILIEGEMFIVAFPDGTKDGFFPEEMSLVEAPI